MKSRLRGLALILSILLLLYVGSYVCFSAGGRFEPMIVDIVGVQLYSWAPQGFFHDHKWDSRLLLFYLPVLRLDWLFWHQSAQIPDSRYPIDKVDWQMPASH